jgi:hypothetical protein
VTVPSTTASGTYYLLACADDTRVVVESNERNNCFASSTTVNVTSSGGGTITLGQTVSGTLSASAPAGHCNFNAPSDRYSFDLSGQTGSTLVTVAESSTAFDSFVCVLDASNNILGQDDDSAGSLNSSIILSLSPGQYYIEASSFSGTGTGAYTLSALPTTVQSAGPISVGNRVAAILSNTASNGVCNGSAPADRWQFTLSATTTVTLEADSTAFDTYLCLLDSNNSIRAVDTDSGPGTNARVVFQNLAAGTYYIEVSSSSTGHAGGAYTLSLQQGLPPGTPISVGQTLSGNLSTTAANGSCNGSAPADRWQFTLSATTTVTLEADSTAFDTYLCLLDSNNSIRAQDDNSGGGTNAKIVITLSPSSAYYIEVSSKSSTGGAYALSLK